MAPAVRPMPVRVVHAHVAPAAIAMMVLGVRLTMARADLATQDRVVPPMTDPQVRRTQDPVGRAMEGREALAILVRAERVKTARRFAGDASMAPCAVCRSQASVPD